MGRHGNMNMNMNKNGGGNANANAGVNGTALQKIRALIKKEYDYPPKDKDQSNFFINLTGPVREEILGENKVQGPSKTIKDNKTILNILSQTEEGNLERKDFNEGGSLDKVKTTLGEKIVGPLTVWSVGGSSSQRMFPMDDTVLNASAGARTSDSGTVAKTLLEGDYKTIVLYNAIGHQYDDVVAEEEFEDNNIKLLTGASLKEGVNYDLLGKILELLKTDKYKNKNVYLIKRGGNIDVDGSHLKQKYRELGSNIPGIEISSGQIKSIDNGNDGYVYKPDKNNKNNEEATQKFKSFLNSFLDAMKEPEAPANGNGNPKNQPEAQRNTKNQATKAPAAEAQGNGNEIQAGEPAVKVEYTKLEQKEIIKPFGIHLDDFAAFDPDDTRYNPYIDRFLSYFEERREANPIRFSKKMILSTLNKYIKISGDKNGNIKKLSDTVSVKMPDDSYFIKKMNQGLGSVSSGISGIRQGFGRIGQKAKSTRNGISRRFGSLFGSRKSTKGGKRRRTKKASQDKRKTVKAKNMRRKNKSSKGKKSKTSRRR